jgi:hypothetical protein
MNSYGLRPYKATVFLLIFLNGSNRSVSLDFGKTTIQKAQLQSLRFGLDLFLVMWTGKIPKGRVNSGFLSELSLR